MASDLVKRWDDASTKATTNLETIGITFDRRRNVICPEIPDDRKPLLKQLLTLAEADVDANAPKEVTEMMLGEPSLDRFLRARHDDVKKAHKMFKSALLWRLEQRPDLISCIADHSPLITPDELKLEGATGKVRHGRINNAIDQHGRPVLILDNTVENTTELGKQMAYMVFHVERLFKKMRHGVEKHVVFIHLSDFSLWNTPSMKSTKTSIDVMANLNPERLGNCILFQPPTYFHALLSSVKLFIDKVTMSKVIIITGDYSHGTKNDKIMSEIIGADWKEMCGVDCERQNSKSTPGYVHERDWDTVMSEEKEFLKR
eukprot:m.107906 g.107906  ORF g.107906 m.107906 type:complete len:316 (-) comp27829_c0_seq1:146-1093(-)